MKRKNVIAITFLIIIALVVYFRYGRNPQSPSDYSMGNINLNELRK
jgi:hypothetical protein